MRNLGFKTFLGAAAFAFALSGPALAADLPAKAAPAPAPATPDFDIAFGGGIMSDYIFRGITQSNHGASATAYFEPRYKEFYVGVAGSGIDWPADATHGLNSPSAEVDFYGGWRPTVGKWSFDFGYIYYLYPNSVAAPIGYTSDFGEIYAKATYAVTDALAIGGAVYYTPNLLNYGGDATYYEVNAKYTIPSSFFAKNWGGYVSGAWGHWDVEGGTRPTVNGTTALVPIPSYSTWNIGGGITYKVFTLDLRYSDTDLGKSSTPFPTAVSGSCQAFWNGGPATSGWCRGAFSAKLTFDVLASALK
jgi:uncharacterized protein (TIGR02001 family)